MHSSNVSTHGMAAAPHHLASQSALDRQIITLNGQEVLADVARLGMVSLYYRTDQGEVGRAVRDGEGWRYEPVTDEAARLQLVDLFDALSKQVRVGFFLLPAAIPAVSAASSAEVAP